MIPVDRISNDERNNMSQEYIEITEKTVDDAITTACRRLSVTSNRLDYIVVQREKSGFLGIGAKPAIIRARAKEAADATQAILDDILNKADKKVKKEAEQAKSASKEKETAAVRQAAPKDSKKAAKAVKEENKAEKKAAREEVKAEKKAEKAENKEGKKNNRRRNRKSSDPAKAAEKNTVARSEEPQVKEAPKAPKKKEVIPELSDEKIAEVKSTAHAFMEVNISEDYEKETAILTINMEGDDMGILIGKRGQTLDSLQYLVSLVVNKNVDGYIHVKADTENYRERRKKTLENLAKNVAAKVKRTRQPSALEPMNPYERRIIHSALQGEKYVTTYSEGEEPYRKVIVALKKDENGEDLLKDDYESGRGRNGRRGNRRDRRGGRDNRRDRRRSKENNAPREEVMDVQAEVEAVISEMDTDSVG